MRDYKLVFAGLVLLFIFIIFGVFSWLWINNQKNTNPLPILSGKDVQLVQESAEEDSDEVKNNADANTLYIQAQQPLQVPLDEVIVRFEARYPQIQVLTNYVPATALLTLDNTNATDIVIAEDQLSDSLLSLLQDELDRNVKNNIVNPPVQSGADTDPEEIAAENSEARTLNPFGYAIKNSQMLEGVIVSAKPVAINFRNFLISSNGQDILREYQFDDINGYQNSVDDLFNPTSDGKTTSEKTEVVKDALTNSE